MTRIIAIIAWIGLLIYGGYYSIFINPGSTFLADLFAGNADPFAFMVFNLLGMIPLAFFVFFQSYYQLKWYHYVFLLGSFVFGGFATGGIFVFPPEEKTPKVTRRVIIAGLLITIAVMTYGLGFGSLTTYLESFQTDTFVHVMTVDFFVLFIFYLALPKLNKGIIQLFFVPAFYIQMLFGDLK